MTNTFNDGDPIDAATLQALLTRLSQVEALAGKKASAGSSINVVPKTAAETTIPKFFGGVTERMDLTAGSYKTFDIDYADAGFSKNPIITITPFCSNITKDVTLAYAPQIVSITKTGAKCRVRVPSGTTAGTARFHFIAVQS
jgi:hypothetical protein